MPSFTVHLDRRYQVAGVYNAGAGKTAWTLPVPDATVNTIVIGEGGLSNAGLIITSGITYNSAQKTYSVNGNYGGYESILGIQFPMQVDLSVPYPISQQQNAEINVWRQVRYLDLAHFRSAGFTVQSAMTGRATRTWTFAGSSDGTAEASGVFRAHCNGNADQQTVSILSSSAKRVCVAAATFNMDANTRRD